MTRFAGFRRMGIGLVFLAAVSAGAPPLKGPKIVFKA